MSLLSRFIPWKYLVKRAARGYGIIDPLNLLARVRRFSQPSEVAEPIELLRAGIVFHARGLVNTKAIQHNLDWVWPYWVSRQFNPSDPSFIPRGFAFSHVNLTHRNWTAVGLPDAPVYPLVDPRGLVTPLYDGWSLDFWLLPEEGAPLLPSTLDECVQSWLLGDDLAVETILERGGERLASDVRMAPAGGRPMLEIFLSARTPGRGRIAVAVRPYNPEGIQFVEQIGYDQQGRCLLVDEKSRVVFDQRPERVLFSEYSEGDVLGAVNGNGPGPGRDEITCEVGMATAAALFPFDREGEVRISMDLSEDMPKSRSRATAAPELGRSWREILAGTARLSVADDRFSFLYDAAVRNLVLLSADEVVPGPYTYRRFWFRDASIMLASILAAGFTHRAGRILDEFPKRQRRSGYFRSQTGEWDSNGQVLWIFDRYLRLSGETIPEAWVDSVLRGAAWIERKRFSNAGGREYPGLLPAGFSAEHFGPNDYYFWDDFWGLAGLQAASRMAREAGRDEESKAFSLQAGQFRKRIFSIIEGLPEARSRGGIPAAPGRRMDSGAIGSLVADYPLQLLPARHPLTSATLEFLLGNCMHGGGFFQDMIHSGINAYLTLDMAQSLLRNHDGRFADLVRAVASLASPTGQWPEAIHPLTLGGCMGDGQHGWAAAEWVMMVRNMFVREEGDSLEIGVGLLPEWLDAGAVSFGPTPTPHGPVSVRMEPEAGGLAVAVTGDFFSAQPRLVIAPPGFEPLEVEAGRFLRSGVSEYRLARKQK